MNKRGSKILNLKVEEFKKYLLTEFKSDKFPPEKIEEILQGAEKFKFGKKKKRNETATTIFTGFVVGAPRKKMEEIWDPQYVRFWRYEFEEGMKQAFKRKKKKHLKVMK